EHLWRLAQGLDGRLVSPEEGYKSIGHETTFDTDTADRDLLHRTLLELCERVAERLRAHGVASRTITLKFRKSDFTTRTRRMTLKEPASTCERIAPVAERLLAPLVAEGKLVRLIGVHCSSLIQERPTQLGLFEPAPRRELAAAVDAITKRFGHASI